MGNYPFQLIKEIAERLQPLLDQNFLFHSRIHPLPGFGEYVFVKREDESGFACSGTKKRKFASLLPHLTAHEVEMAILIGGANSNHIMGLSQLIREKGIDFQLFLKKASQHYKQGNAFLLKILADKNQIHWIEGKDWPNTLMIAQAYGEQTGKNWMVIPEGGNCKEAVAGAATLMLDIIENEQKSLSQVVKNNDAFFSFDHIWVDSGTGLTAAVLVAMNALLSRKTHIHVVLMAGDEDYFIQTYQQVASWLAEMLALPIPPISQYSLYFPITAKSFGAINTQVKKAVVDFSRTAGILTDPVYTAKLFLTAREKISSGQYKGSHLIIHSGGGTGLMGFADQMEKVL